MLSIGFGSGRRAARVVPSGVRLLSVPGEAFHALGRALEQTRDDKALLAEHAPIYHGYLPRPFGSGYEEKLSNGRRFVTQLAAALTACPPTPRSPPT